MLNNIIIGMCGVNLIAFGCEEKILSKELLFAHSAVTPAQKLAPSRDTYGRTQEKSPSVANSVNFPAQQLLTSRHTQKCIWEKNLSTPHSVTTPAQS